MEVVKMNANVLPPVFYTPLTLLYNLKKFILFLGQKLGSSYETQIKAEICPECNTY